MMLFMGELIDIYDENRNFTGITIDRKDARLSDGHYMLYVLAIIENASGEMLITRRGPHESYAAGWWEIPGGAVDSGESPAQAVVREVKEEVGLDVSKEDLTPVYTYANVDSDAGDNYFVDFFHFHLDISDSDISLGNEDTVDFAFASWDDIVKLNDEKHFLHFRRLAQARDAEASDR